MVAHPTRLSREDLRRLREAHLAAQRAELFSQLSQQRLAALVRELEWRYGLLGLDGTVDIHTGRIERKDTPPHCETDAGGGPASKGQVSHEPC